MRIKAANAEAQVAVEEREPDERDFEEAGGTAEGRAAEDRQAGGPQAGIARDGAQAGRGELGLAGQSNEEVAAPEQGRQADAKRDSITPTVIDRAADVAASQGQSVLFDAKENEADG